MIRPHYEVNHIYKGGSDGESRTGYPLMDMVMNKEDAEIWLGVDENE